MSQVASAALTARLSKQSAQPGETVQLILGPAAEDFLAPLNMYLVPLEVASQIADQSDSRLIEIASLGTPGSFDVPRVFVFTVPDVPPGEYAVALWFRGTATREWANALEGIEPTLSVTRSSTTRDGWGAGLGIWFVALGAAGGLLVAGFLLGRRLLRRR